MKELGLDLEIVRGNYWLGFPNIETMTNTAML